MSNRTHSQARTVKSNEYHSNKLTTLKHGQVVTDSQAMAKSLGIRHAKFIEVLQGLLDDYPELRDSNLSTITKKAVLSKDTFSPLFTAFQAMNRGQPFTAYLINEAGFYLLLPRFKTERAKQAYLEFVIAFQRMKHALLQAEANTGNLLFQQLRIEGKTVRRNLTDTLKEFAEYSKEQGSKGSAYVYSNTTRSIYKALDIYATDAPLVRDSLSVDKLQQLEALEESVGSCIADGMESGIDYKLIKETVKRTIDNYTEGSYHHSRTPKLVQS